MTDADREKVKEIRERSVLDRALLASADVSGLLAVIDRLEADSKLDRDILGDWLGHSESVQARLVNDVIERTRRETVERCWLLAGEIERDFGASATELEDRGYGPVQIDRSSGYGAMRVAERIAREFGLEQS